jgi:hypothetical protein
MALNNLVIFASWLVHCACGDDQRNSRTDTL